MSSGDREDASRGVGSTVIHDLRHGDLPRAVRRDLRELYDFYLNEEHRARLARMGRFHRGLVSLAWLLRDMILKLTPGRRIMLLVAFLLSIEVRFSLHRYHVEVSSGLALLSFALAVVVLMLELKDKLLAHDELEVARAVQVALLPGRNPLLPGWEIWLFTRPANDVGGDLVDYLELGDGRLGVALGDVAGKGLGAALLMAKLQATLRALAPLSASLAELGDRLNAIFCRDGVQERFATLVYVEIRADTDRIRVLNAGHPAPVARGRSAGAWVTGTLPHGGLPLGLFPESRFEEQTVRLIPGETLLVYSDGLTEAANDRGEFYGEARLGELLGTLPEMSAEALGAAVRADVDRFMGSARPADDLSLVVVRRLPG